MTSIETATGLKSARNADFIIVNSPLRDYYCRTKDDYEVLPPIGEAYIASTARSRDFNVGLIDAEHRGMGVQELANTVNGLKPRFTGINILTPTREVALLFALSLDPEIPLVIGGAHASALPQETIKEFTTLHPKTILIRGEAEEAVAQLLDGISCKRILYSRIANRNSTGNVCYCENGA